MSEDEQRLFRLYGKLPTKKDLLQSKLRERKYFDSGDYALQKAGKTSSDTGVPQIGVEHPLPENIPHLTPTTSNSSQNSINGTSGIIGGSAGSPVKECSILHRGTSVDEIDNEEDDVKEGEAPKTGRRAMPILGPGRQAPGTGMPGLGKVPPFSAGRPLRNPIKSPMSQVPTKNPTTQSSVKSPMNPDSTAPVSPPADQDKKGIPIRWQS